MGEDTHIDPAYAIRLLRAEGYVVLPGLLAPETIKTLRAELRDMRRDKSEEGKPDFTESLLESPLLDLIVGEVLGEDTQILQSEAVVCAPGQPFGKLFCSETGWEEARPRPPVSVTIHWAIDPCVEQNGAPRIAAGSHTWGPEHPERPIAPSFDGRLDETVVVEVPTVPLIMEPGDGAIVLGTCWMRSGANRSRASRIAIETLCCQIRAKAYVQGTMNGNERAGT